MIAVRRIRIVCIDADSEGVTKVGKAPDMRSHLAAKAGELVYTLTGQPNRIIEVSGDEVLVGTTKSPEGRWVPIAEVQAAADRLFDRGEVEISVQSVGYRSAFVGAALTSLAGTVAGLRPGRVILSGREPAC